MTFVARYVTVGDDPQCVIVLTENELLAVDLTSDGWPLHRVPYLVNVSASSAVTCCEHAAGVSDDVWANIITAGNSHNGQWSTKVLDLVNVS